MSRYTAVPLLDAFIKDAPKADSDILIRQRLIVAIAYTCIGCLAAIATWLSFIDIPVKELQVGWLTCSIMFSCFVGVLLVLKHSSKNALGMASSIMVGATCCVSFYGMFYTGGPINSYVASLLILPPVMAFFLLGSANGWAWTLITLCAYGFMAGIELKGYHYPDQFSGDKKGIEVFFFSYALIMIASLAYIYERLYRYQLHAKTNQQKRYEYLALHDPLTELANRKLFTKTFEAALSRAKREQYSIAFLMIDLDHFKPLNDLHGHHVGDQILQHVATTLKNNIRGNDLAARLGGDEFAVILENVDHSDIAFIADKILKAINTSLQFDIAGSVEVSCSIGIAISNPSHTLEEQTTKLYQQADKALYKAKLKRNNWCFLNDGGDIEQDVFQHAIAQNVAQKNLSSSPQKTPKKEKNAHKGTSQENSPKRATQDTDKQKATSLDAATQRRKKALRDTENSAS